jgi:hypothetical protein
MPNRSLIIIDEAFSAAEAARNINNVHLELVALSRLADALQDSGRGPESRYIWREIATLAGASGTQEIESKALSKLGMPPMNPAQLERLDNDVKRNFLHGSGETEMFSDEKSARASNFYATGKNSADSSRNSTFPLLVEVASGFVVAKFIGSFLQAFATKLGEDIGESSARAVHRLRLLHKTKGSTNIQDSTDDLDIILTGGKRTTLILPENFSDAAKLAIIDTNFSSAEVQGFELQWNAEEMSWSPTVPIN